MGLLIVAWYVCCFVLYEWYPIVAKQISLHGFNGFILSLWVINAGRKQ